MFMENLSVRSLKGKKAFITGGANGIGRGILRTFCEVGFDVAFCDTDIINGEQLMSELSRYNCRFIPLDVRDKNALTVTINDLLEKWGDIDVIINNVGVSRFSSILETSVEDFEEVLDINLRTVFITSKLLAECRNKSNQKDGYGRIINMASTRYLMSEPDSEAYAASKGGIVSLTHALAVSLAKYKITVNCISPGWIETGDYNDLREEDHLQHPAGRVGKPGDIARMCLFLCLPDNDFITGQNFVIDGGMTKKMIYKE